MSARANQGPKPKRVKTPEEQEKAAELKRIRDNRALAKKDAEAALKALGFGPAAITATKYNMRPDDEVTAAIGQLVLLGMFNIVKNLVYKRVITAEEVARAFKALPWNLRQGDRNLEVSRSHMQDAYDLQVEIKLYASLKTKNQTLNDSYKMQQYLREIFWVLHGPYIEMAEDQGKEQAATEFRDEVAAYLDLTISEEARTNPDVREANFRDRVLVRHIDEKGLDLWQFPPDVRYKGAPVVAFYLNPATKDHEEEIVPVGELLAAKGLPRSRFAYVGPDNKLRGVPADWSPRDPKVFDSLIEIVKSLDTPVTVALDKLTGVATKKQYEKLPEEWFDPPQLLSLFEKMMRQAEQVELNSIEPARKEEVKERFRVREVHADAMSELLRELVMTAFNLFLLGKEMANHANRKVKMTRQDFRAHRAITVKQDMASGAVSVEKPKRNECYPYQPVAEAGVFLQDLPAVMAENEEDIVAVLEDNQESLVAAGAREEGGLHYA